MIRSEEGCKKCKFSQTKFIFLSFFFLILTFEFKYCFTSYSSDSVCGKYWEGTISMKVWEKLSNHTGFFRCHELSESSWIITCPEKRIKSLFLLINQSLDMNCHQVGLILEETSPLSWEKFQGRDLSRNYLQPTCLPAGK